MDTANQDIADAPLPTRRTLRTRHNMAYQLIRFALFNLRMLKMVGKGHD
ncbi:hypothetical protein [Ferrimicrobium sp.]|nr:hypothetical protein [Ferrimicrobium sp.]